MNSQEARNALGKRIRELRTGQKLSVRGFALMIGMNKDYIVDIEYGRKSPTLDTLVKVASGLGVTLSDLFEGVDSPESFEREKGASAGDQGSAINYRSITL